MFGHGRVLEKPRYGTGLAFAYIYTLSSKSSVGFVDVSYNTSIIRVSTKIITRYKTVQRNISQ